MDDLPPASRQPQPQALPDHVEHSVRAIAQLHDEHLRRVSKFQHLVNATVEAVGRPRSLGLLTAVLALWVGGNLLARAAGYRAFDPPPFQWLELCGSFLALYLTLLILMTQRHDDEIAQHRDQLTLQLSILSDQKAAKIISLLEELRRDSPHLANRLDHGAAAMATPVDPQSVLDAIRQSSVVSGQLSVVGDGAPEPPPPHPG